MTDAFLCHLLYAVCCAVCCVLLVMQVELTHEQAIEEISVRLSTAPQLPNMHNYQKCLSAMFWVRRNSTLELLDSLQFNNRRDNLQTRLARSEEFISTANRVSWTSQGEADCKVAKVYTLVQPHSPFCTLGANKGVAVTELQLFTQVDLHKFRSKANIWDSTFHRECSHRQSVCRSRAGGPTPPAVSSLTGCFVARAATHTPCLPARSLRQLGRMCRREGDRSAAAPPGRGWLLPVRPAARPGRGGSAMDHCRVWQGRAGSSVPQPG